MTQLFCSHMPTQEKQHLCQEPPIQEACTILPSSSPLPTLIFHGSTVFISFKTMFYLIYGYI